MEEEKNKCSQYKQLIFAIDYIEQNGTDDEKEELEEKLNEFFKLGEKEELNIEIKEIKKDFFSKLANLDDNAPADKVEELFTELIESLQNLVNPYIDEFKCKLSDKKNDKRIELMNLTNNKKKNFFSNKIKEILNRINYEEIISNNINEINDSVKKLNEQNKGGRRKTRKTRKTKKVVKRKTRRVKKSRRKTRKTRKTRRG